MRQNTLALHLKLSLSSTQKETGISESKLHTKNYLRIHTHEGEGDQNTSKGHGVRSHYGRVGSKLLKLSKCT